MQFAARQCAYSAYKHTEYTQHAGGQSAAFALSAISKSTPVPAAVLKRTRGKEGMCFSQFSCQSLTLPSHLRCYPPYLIIRMVISSSHTLSYNLFISHCVFLYLFPNHISYSYLLTPSLSQRISLLHLSFLQNDMVVPQSCSYTYKIVTLPLPCFVHSGNLQR